MSGRTIVVGILAAFCGILATVGVTMLMNQGEATKQKVVQTVLVSLVELEPGQQIEENMLEMIEWHSDKLPPGSFTSKNEVIGSYATRSIAKGNLIVKSEIAAQPTNLSPAPGKIAFTIETRTASSNVGANLTAGNRVDILWTTNNASGTPSEKPVTVRLIQNVKVLAVGQVSGEKDKAQKSITFELGHKMDENLMYAQLYGTLALSLRNASDDADVEPREVTNLMTLMQDFIAKEKQAAQPTALEISVSSLINQFADLKKSLSQSPPEVVVRDRKTLERIKQGMRALTIETPTESTALAGLLEPGDRIDLLLTVKDLRLLGLTASDAVGEQVPSETLIVNVEILAVDTQLEVIEGDDQKKMSTSVTFIIKNEMAHDIARAKQIGTLTMVLRGKFEDDGADPRTVMTVDEFISRHMPVATAAVDTQLASVSASTEIKIRTLRGGSVQEIPVVMANAKN